MALEPSCGRPRHVGEGQIHAYYIAKETKGQKAMHAINEGDMEVWARNGLCMCYKQKLSKSLKIFFPLWFGLSRILREKRVFLHTREKEARLAKEKGRRSERKARNLKSSSFLGVLANTKVSL